MKVYIQSIIYWSNSCFLKISFNSQIRASCHNLACIFPKNFNPEQQSKLSSQIRGQYMSKLSWIWKKSFSKQRITVSLIETSGLHSFIMDQHIQKTMSELENIRISKIQHKTVIPWRNLKSVLEGHILFQNMVGAFGFLEKSSLHKMKEKSALKIFESALSEVIKSSSSP